MKTIELLKTPSINATTFRRDIFNIMKEEKSTVVTLDSEKGEKKMVFLPFEDYVELLEIMEETRDAVLRQEITRARNEYKRTGGEPL